MPLLGKTYARILFSLEICLGREDYGSIKALQILVNTHARKKHFSAERKCARKTDVHDSRHYNHHCDCKNLESTLTNIYVICRLGGPYSEKL